VSVRNLELVEPLFSGETTQTTLFYTLDACCTPMGKRLLRSTLLRPSSERAEIAARLDAVAEAMDLRRREALRRAMDGILDLERLLARVALDSAGPREVLAVAATLGCLPNLLAAAQAFTAARWAALAASFDTLADLHQVIIITIADEPPVSLSDGGIIRAGVDAELDELRELSRSGRQALAAIEERQQRLRLLHRGHQGEHEGCARGLRAQADAGERRALYHAGAQGV
jgi:DNA mismatch repair protein MutS